MLRPPPTVPPKRKDNDYVDAGFAPRAPTPSPPDAERQSAVSVEAATTAAAEEPPTIEVSTANGSGEDSTQQQQQQPQQQQQQPQLTLTINGQLIRVDRINICINGVGELPTASEGSTATEIGVQLSGDALQLGGAGADFAKAATLPAKAARAKKQSILSSFHKRLKHMMPAGSGTEAAAGGSGGGDVGGGGGSGGSGSGGGGDKDQQLTAGTDDSQQQQQQQTLDSSTADGDDGPCEVYEEEKSDADSEIDMSAMPKSKEPDGDSEVPAVKEEAASAAKANSSKLGGLFSRKKDKMGKKELRRSKELLPNFNFPNDLPDNVKSLFDITPDNRCLGTVYISDAGRSESVKKQKKSLTEGGVKKFSAGGKSRSVWLDPQFGDSVEVWKEYFGADDGECNKAFGRLVGTDKYGYILPDEVDQAKEFDTVEARTAYVDTLQSLSMFQDAYGNEAVGDEMYM